MPKEGIVPDKKLEKKKLQWLGAQALLGNAPEGSKEAKEKKLVLTTSRVLRISPFGVNILGSLPYINKIGLGQKASAYCEGVRFLYDWVQIAKEDGDKAICKCKLVDAKGKDLCDWILGECSPSTTKMGTLKGYQNHIAQTRAKNRAINETYGVRMHEEMIENIQKLAMGQEITSDEAEKMGGAVTTSSEELEYDEPVKKEKKDEKTYLMRLQEFLLKTGKIINIPADFLPVINELGKTAYTDLNQITEPQAQALLALAMKANLKE